MATGLARVSDEFRGLEGKVFLSRRENGIEQTDYRFALDGAAIIRDTLISSSSELENFLATTRVSSPHQFADWWGENAKNPHALFILHSPTERAFIVPDPLGAAPIFHYSNSGINVYSADLEAAVSFVEYLGLKLTKSTEFQLQRVVLGNGGYNASPYEEITTFDPFHYFEITESGFSAHQYSVFNQLNEPYSYIGEMTRLRQDLLSSVRAVANSGKNVKISHITGGFDSRLLLSLILELDAKDEFDFFCSGPVGAADRIVADSITRQFGLSRTNKAGLSPGPTDSRIEQLFAPLFFSHGISATGPNGREEKSGILAVGGGYGGLLRSTFGARMQGLSTESPAQHVFSKFDPYYKHDSSILSDASLSKISESLRYEWQKLGRFYNDPSQFGDALYLHIRNKYHFGYNAMQWSRIGTRVDPLYSVNGYFLSLRSTPEVRASNQIGYDLLAAASTKLLEIPFDKPKFDHELISRSRPTIATKSTMKWTPEVYSNIDNPAFNNSSVLPQSVLKYSFTDSPASPSLRKKFIEKANKIGLNYWQIANMGSAQGILSQAILSGNLDDFQRSLPPNFLHKLATKELVTRVEIRNLYSALGAALWLND
ncbi:hypothetical protein [Glutamicibacter arilaitensis]|uniref:Asparagine synthetase domain-containing protein n=1 Tax=Glutamicibacter arilaitensis TaxID=256701 RepID=A0A4Y8TYZ2_9MICC|nr:hypothetical protein [Glutamicibacter arilaitensis]TFH57416.1 hypothetical protein EXY26_10640 [Glutamicibacter arilaitensis]